MFKDTAKHWANNAINRLAKLNIINGYSDKTFKPDNPITRAEVASIVNKYDIRRKQVVRECVPSVVRIETDKTLGSGVVLDKEGYIVTNVHVCMDGLDPAKFVKVYLDGLPNTGINARVVLGFYALDIAILKIDNIPEKYLIPAPIATEIELLDDIFCIGNPLGYANTVSQGVVTFVDRKTTTNWIQTDASINPGNSGGGAFNIMGELIGMPSWKVAEVPGMGVPAEGIGFIAPYYKIKEVYDKARG